MAKNGYFYFLTIYRYKNKNSKIVDFLFFQQKVKFFENGHF